MRNRLLPITFFFAAMYMMISCKSTSTETAQLSPVLAPDEIPFTWNNANVYFLLTDRFNNGDPTNDYDYTGGKQAAPLRGYMGGDFKGIIDKLEENYFTDLGINAIWISPVVEQIEGSVDEGTGTSFGFHGYWTKDWTAINPIQGTAEELRTLIKTAHEKDIRVLLDVVINHTGPVTPMDPLWPAEWVKTAPQCTYTNMETTVNCTLVKNLPDIRTDNRTESVDLPKVLLDKWTKEGRLDQELDELDQFFERTSFPRSPYHHIIKWVVDYIVEFGFDGFRVDTVKHTEGYVWDDLWKVASEAWERWKKEHPEEAIDDAKFYMVGEVYNYFINNGKLYDYGDQKVNFFDNGFHSLINFDFKSDANRDFDQIFVKYDTLLNGPLQNHSVLNYISSHDDGGPFDLKRERSIEAASKLMLTPGGVQMYYGDETARKLNIEDADGDAKLRSFMNWEEMEQNVSRNGIKINEILNHWQKLGTFRNAHPAIGAGRHQQLNQAPYVFSRVYDTSNGQDRVVVGLDLPIGPKELKVSEVFNDGTQIKDYYSGLDVTVENGLVRIDSPFNIVLLGK